jgi:hypothetical protein
MKFMVLNRNITHICLDGVVEVPAGRLAQELERLGYEPMAKPPPSPGLVFDNALEAEENVVAPPPQEITKIHKTENRKQRTRK